MYNEKILNQLDNLKYLGALKGSNISVVSKPNEFGDTVKFYAQINKEDIIQKITYRASGCTHFLVFCNYFCSLVEGKTIKSALNVKAEKLENFVELDEGKTHIITIILDAFALLIKRYRKGVEKGKIEPCETEQKGEDAPKSRPMTSKSFTKVVGEIMKNIELSHQNDNTASAKNSDTLSKLMDIKNKNHSKIEEKKSLEQTQPVVEEKSAKKEVKTTEEKVVVEPTKEEVKVEEKPVEKKTTKRAKKEKVEDAPVETKNIDKDELLENLIDEGIFLDDYLSNKEEKTATEEVVVEEEPKAKKTTKKASTKKAKEEPVVENTENEKTIEELNKEITGLIDIFEEDEVASVEVKEEPADVKTEETQAKEKETPKKEKKVAKKETQPKAEKTKKTTKKAEPSKEVVAPVEEKVNAQEKQSSNLLALKSMLNSRNSTKPVEEKKPETKVNNLNAMISKMNSNKSTENKTTETEVKKEKPVEKAKQEDRLSSLKLSLANIKTSNETTSKEKTTQKTNKAEKPVEKKEKVKAEKSKPAKKEVAKKESKKVEKKPVEKKEKQPKEVAPKKSKKNSYDMDYETIDYSSKKGLFSWLRRK